MIQKFNSRQIASALWQMKLHLFLLLSLLIPSISETHDIPHYSTRYDDFDTSIQLPRTSLLHLSEKRNTELIATLDGTVSLVDIHHNKVLWSFGSGPSIYSSYQAPINQEEYDKGNFSGLSSTFFLDYGDDWELYTHYRQLGGKGNVTIQIEDIIKTTPLMFEDGGVMLGSKKTTVFLVDARTGSVINSYKSSDDKKNGSYNKNIQEWVEPSFAKQFPLYITRKDYTLHAFAPYSDKVLWNVSVAVIEAVLLCQDSSISLARTPLLSRFELGSALNNHPNMPLACHSKILVRRLHSDDLSEFFFNPRLPNPIPIFPLQTRADEVLDTHEKLMLPMSESKLALPSEPDLHELHVSQSSALTPFSQPNHNMKIVIEFFSEGFFASIYMVIRVAFLMIILFSSVFTCVKPLIRNGVYVKQKHSSPDEKPSSKKKRNRKSGKCSSGEKKEKRTSSEEDDKAVFTKIDFNVLLNENKLFDDAVNGHGRRVGKLFISNKEIAHGSNGTILFEGNYNGRSVAVKRLLRARHDVAFKEIKNLIASDQHPNIVRWFGVEYDQDFVYLSLERCNCSLSDLILAYSDFNQNDAFTDHNLQLEILKNNNMHDIKLWKRNGRPTPLLLKLMSDVVSGLTHLHELGIIHRDLKPQNVLINGERLLCAKLSDMGISKCLPDDMSSLGLHSTGSGSSGWQAPERLGHGRQTRAVDIFSLGCIIFFCMTGGRHPFGDHLERDINIVRNRVDLFLVDSIPEAVDLVSCLLNPNPELRPKAEEILFHPLFWSSDTRLSFLGKTSDRLELEDRETDSELVQALENIAPIALGASWDTSLDDEFISNIGRYRRYKFDTVRDLLRVMRNKYNHYGELPRNIQELLGRIPEGFDEYFARRFPKLLIEVYKVVHAHCRSEEWFEKYFETSDL